MLVNRTRKLKGGRGKEVRRWKEKRGEMEREMGRWKQERANCGKGEKCRKSKRLEKPNWEVKSIQAIGDEGSWKEVHL